jgi:PAS domain S-box-containing protein
LLTHVWEQQSLAAETLERYREINLLYKVGETINASLDPVAIPDLVLEEAGRIIRTDVGSVVLLDAEGQIEARAAFGPPALQAHLKILIEKVLLTQSESLTGAQILTEEQFNAPVPLSLTTVLCAPLRTRKRLLGLIVLGRREGDRVVFTAGDRKLLMALVSQTAVAVENAYLFADVKQQRDAIAEMKTYRDNIFASIASGVITTDMDDRVTLMNAAAEEILGQPEQSALGKPWTRVVPELKQTITPLVRRVKERERSLVGIEVQAVLNARGPVNLRLNVSPVKNNAGQTTGIALVLDDLTERRQLEARVDHIRGTFERYISPRVVEQLLSNPSSVQLGGARQEVTILFADIRGFTTFSEKIAPESLFEILNRHLTVAAQAVLEQDGTLDKFMGDAVMALFNAPLAQPDHTLRAVHAALQMKRALIEMHTHMEPEQWLKFGVGISTGPAVVGNVGSPALQNYTAVGDTVNVASRLQSHAGPGQILIGERAYASVRQHLRAQRLGYAHLKGRSEPYLIYEVQGLRKEAAEQVSTSA